MDQDAEAKHSSKSASFPRLRISLPALLGRYPSGIPQHISCERSGSPAAIFHGRYARGAMERARETSL